MGKPHPMELRTRVVAYVDEGHGHRTTARHFRVSPKFVNDLVKLRRETGSLAAARQRRQARQAGRCDKLDRSPRRRPGEITLDELAAELSETYGIDAHRSTVWRVLRGLGLTHKKRPAGA